MAGVKDAFVRVRSEGHTFFGDAYIVPANGDLAPDEIETAINALKAIDWRLHEVSLTPVVSLETEIRP